MNIEEINKIIDDTEARIKNIKEMIEDYNLCVNETSKTFLLAAITKYSQQFKTQSTTN